MDRRKRARPRFVRIVNDEDYSWVLQYLEYMSIDVVPL